ncbi:Gfo/Idh/MocA family oxidoreductase [Kineosporia sp. NBRC 101731]|uniref:Gfo/Idh/MocA family oxidoreductase n=1 Tax=Kineosporia sp. NBRC 101731 TaxID=3032199 RepID=UPI0024A0E65E|nr:Gfo/Idh/MocA family oxidoreductase [Kineosporia sp. NBRC 101731]GLY29434.1 myo-inositol dehydrogenase [Kineosporia sp. NBRC 101731]
MQPLRIGVIGAGMMGSAHVRTITSDVPAARVTAVFDPDPHRAARAADPVRARVFADAGELIGHPDVDAVVIASPDVTHAALARACIAAGRPVLCEKPLAVTASDAYSVVEAELSAGKRLVQVGFMRRYDPGFVDLRRTVSDGTIGDVRVVHAVHRNAANATSTDDAGLVTGSMVHELDLIPWLVGSHLTAIRVESPVRNGFRDPQLATLWTGNGVMASVEVFVNAAYGYDVRCECVGTLGTVSLATASPVSSRIAGVEGRVVRSDFVAHFAEAYRIELGRWAGSVRTGSVWAADLGGPSAWDGYAAQVAAEAGVASLASGAIETVEPGPRPPLYVA